MKAVSVRISGKVQGVFFRVTAQKVAEKLDVTGWVRNTDDGCVDIHAEGEECDIDSFLEWCHNGPSGATVTEVNSTETTPISSHSFDILR